MKEKTRDSAQYRIFIHVWVLEFDIFVRRITCQRIDENAVIDTVNNAKVCQIYVMKTYIYHRAFLDFTLLSLVFFLEAPCFEKNINQLLIIIKLRICYDEK